jgi:alkylation response protein AidB-like acyl-CoA dehydrogenase
MTQLQEHHVKDIPNNPLSVAAKLAQTLTVSAVERDRQAGLPIKEVHSLKTSGLLPLVVPRKYGGIGATWGEAFKVVQTLAGAEGSIGQLYANQLILSVVGHTAGTPEQGERYYRATANHNLFWGNAFNTRDTRLKIASEGKHYRVNGVKTFGTGVAVADLRVFSAVQAGVDYPIVFILPKEREGIVYNDDWDNMGQRRTASGSFTFQNVLVTSDEILGPPPYPESGFATVLFVVNQLAKTHVYLGIAEGAFEAAKNYTMTQTRPWIMSGVDHATQDPYILKHYGELWMQLQAAIGLAEKAAQRVQIAWEQEWALTPQERGEVAISVYAAKAMAAQVGLEITNRMFEMTGARSTAAKYGFDRYWRDLRTFTLHDPIDYKLRDIGNWALNQALPIVSQYS